MTGFVLQGHIWSSDPKLHKRLVIKHHVTLYGQISEEELNLQKISVFEEDRVQRSWLKLNNNVEKIKQMQEKEKINRNWSKKEQLEFSMQIS